MEEEEFRKALDAFCARSRGVLRPVYGGDGALVSAWRTLGPREALLPVRNYGMCARHRGLYEKAFAGEEPGEDGRFLRQSLMPVLECAAPGGRLEALSEFAVTCGDPTAALRFDVLVNGRPFAENVIANGVVVATRLGSTGYFKSVARTVFAEGIGVGFVCPTYSIPALVAARTDKVAVALRRESPVALSADKEAVRLEAPEGWRLEISHAGRNVPVFGYEHFMCPDCRRGRNSSVVNDMYALQPRA